MKILFFKTLVPATFYDLDLSKKVSAESLSSRSGHKPGDESLTALAMNISEIEKYVNDDGGVLKKSLPLVLFFEYT